ncbi:uncharacterized protein Z520_06120 [Fonsecaea multimorphosa CBS 102226]|uniref:Zn(2)-C6 fungal-type domain-containing protein n=1 Tax=Fonsecaea multimorphosa CBS 102226 TaxID=1442371 RepID=A0A0D2IM08_9EURO|nr:uncharacterized protein Z520_06120 [Fonsecaea multimorphosa CBS 102226]KIX98041.1 hypothetical protein Z520_06120 [Fonsecaea multimorphosa CBS 102226]
MANLTPGVEFADRACNSCRQRRVKCDKRLPACLRCEKLGRPCTGYDLERKFLDEGIKVRRKYDGNFQSPDFTKAVVSNSPRVPAAAVPDRRINLPPIHNIPSIPQVNSPPISSVPNPPGRQGASNRVSIPNIQFPAFGILNQQGPDFNLFPNTPPQPALSAPPPSATPTNFQYAATPPQFPDHGQYTHQEHPTAKLLHGKPQYAPSDLDSSVSEDYFDLDIDTYYANGNNACGFIPGLPVILTDTNVPESDDDFLTSDFASISGRTSSVYDGQVTLLSVPPCSFGCIQRCFIPDRAESNA